MTVIAGHIVAITLLLPDSGTTSIGRSEYTFFVLFETPPARRLTT
jgi:hypothetical protein